MGHQQPLEQKQAACHDHGTATITRCSHCPDQTNTDLFGSTAFGVVQSDMNGNIKKIQDRLMTNPIQNGTLQDLVLAEKGEKTKTATQGLLWLMRGLEFTAVGLRRQIDNKDEELAKSFTEAYNATLTKHHSMLVRPIFKLAMKSCPYRKDLFEKLGQDQTLVWEQFVAWVEGLEKIVDIIKAFYLEGNYGKGL